MPTAVFSVLEAHDFPWKRIAPFRTHEESSQGRSFRDLKGACPRSIVFDGLANRGRGVGSARKDVLSWLERIGLQ